MEANIRVKQFAALTPFLPALARIRIKALHQTALWPSVPLRATIGQVLAGERHNVRLQFDHMKSKLLILALSIACISAVAGCGTARVYSGLTGQGWEPAKPYGVQEVRPTLYQSVQVDAALVGESLSELSHLPLVIFPLIDFPVAVVIDTLLLPYDLNRKSNWTSSFSTAETSLE